MAVSCVDRGAASALDLEPIGVDPERVAASKRMRCTA
eukprot:CAMPEP_0171252370 /NCGR_PEP_ID=MMETSP0790-20130122/51131_1 /TAXON_ID=2925 /ORGANISM="Alexandrium catenella, Strain OF101" /LENGTH=36 /DNA_ID= /DNA_START= /DNA_END= /DNA_ORIENTATION=